MNKDDIKKKIDTLLSLSVASQVLSLNSDTVERAYEAYIWSLCKCAVESAGGTATLMGINSGANPSTVVLRGAPGNMDSTAQDYCYILCELNGKEFEIHVDVKYEGSSKAIHEIDVSMCNHDGAEAVRLTRRLPKASKLIVIIECKFYTASTPGAAQGREFVGLISDCSRGKLNAFVSNKASENLDKYFSNNKKLQPFTDLDPADKDAEERFIRNVEQALRKWAK